MAAVLHQWNDPSGPRIMPMQRALISVFDKAGIEEFGKFLAEQGVHILSTGGTAAALIKAGIPVTEVADHTGFPEMMDGRVKTLHPMIHGGFLYERNNPEHVAQANKHKIEPIDLLVVSLYPFEETLAKMDAGQATHKDVIEKIDIGGPAMIRGAAKNHEWVTVITSTDQYATVVQEMKEIGGTAFATRKSFAGLAYKRTGFYDRTIGEYFDRPW